jgi:hypothetical protein
LEIRRGIKGIINTYNKAYILLYFLLKLNKGRYKQNRARIINNIKGITLKNFNSILNVNKLITLFINIIKVGNVS